MTIDKFGRHIHNYSLKKRLRSENVIKHIFTHHTAKEVILSHIKPISVKGGSLPRKNVITLVSDGTVDLLGFYRLSYPGKSDKYTNKLYKGQIIDVVVSDSNLVQLMITTPPYLLPYDPAKTYYIQEGAVFSLKYIGPTKKPKPPVMVYVEILVEDTNP